ncbi:MAG: hypothetical protein LBG59_01365 [Candidatus Peribacteria bacterium]|jgi:hypothetical protein|nr:hypothetical protein [Candidatus Peribacteria bacterium]
MTSNEQYINILSVYNKVRELYINDENLVSAIREAYLGGMQKKALIEKYLPVEFEKSINVSIMIINDILKGISENERKKIAEERQIANLLLQNSVQQSARGKI